ncbi:hypothetical protein ADUPG1_010288 [Aduncisulcus paluster]|uniref:Uncharacterized protein n=1 Tax=Aduncisulcus paluster TaxID=2918883 RepID=A0ABQ5JQN9_9EUKA|nr:hypothetical protein ADUPG1_010288 [Aduncisulcus paluster]
MTNVITIFLLSILLLSALVICEPKQTAPGIAFYSTKDLIREAFVEIGVYSCQALSGQMFVDPFHFSSESFELNIDKLRIDTISPGDFDAKMPVSHDNTIEFTIKNVFASFSLHAFLTSPFLPENEFEGNVNATFHQTNIHLKTNIVVDEKGRFLIPSNSEFNIDIGNISISLISFDIEPLTGETIEVTEPVSLDDRYKPLWVAEIETFFSRWLNNHFDNYIHHLYDILYPKYHLENVNSETGRNYFIDLSAVSIHTNPHSLGEGYVGFIQESSIPNFYKHIETYLPHHILFPKAEQDVEEDEEDDEILPILQPNSTNDLIIEEISLSGTGKDGDMIISEVSVTENDFVAIEPKDFSLSSFPSGSGNLLHFDEVNGNDMLSMIGKDVNFGVGITRESLDSLLYTGVSTELFGHPFFGDWLLPLTHDIHLKTNHSFFIQYVPFLNVLCENCDIILGTEQFGEVSDVSITDKSFQFTLDVSTNMWLSEESFDDDTNNENFDDMKKFAVVCASFTFNGFFDKRTALSFKVKLHSVSNVSIDYEDNEESMCLSMTESEEELEEGSCEHHSELHLAEAVGKTIVQQMINKWVSSSDFNFSVLVPKTVRSEGCFYSSQRGYIYLFARMDHLFFSNKFGECVNSFINEYSSDAVLSE